MEVREMQQQDAPGVSGLLRQLGYSVTPHEVVRRLELIAGQSDHFALVALDAAGLAGLAHAYISRHLEISPGVFLATLVVDETRRGSGAGKSLLAEVEKWAIANGQQTIRLYSSTHRDGAHAFYEAQGYARIKSSFRFEKSL